MRFKNKKQEGFSIIEAVIAAVIFSIAAIGMYTTISVMRQPARVSEKEVKAAYYAQKILNKLRKSVDQATWNAGNLAVGSYALSEGIYNAVYVVTDDPSGARKVTVTITWDE